MTRFWRVVWSGGLLAPLLAAPLAAQGGADGTGFDVLRYSGSVRGIGLNGAGAAIVGDAGALFSNPAGIATIHHIGLEAAYHQFPGSERLATGALAWRLGQFDLGGGLEYLDLSTGAAGPGAYQARGVGTMVYRFGFLALGASATALRQRAAGIEQRGVSGDLGVAIPVFDIMALGFAVQNVAGNLDKTSSLTFPKISRLGFTMNYTDPEESFRLLSTIEAQWPEGRDARVIVGGELGLVISGVGVVGRAAYGSNALINGRSTVTVGVSVHFGQLEGDYAYDPGSLPGDNGHHLGVRLTL
ncbi:MAG TPA: hypothetical protein VGI83_01670 [Gemmatimonadales bacterium]|jgi:hypothetical protein